MTDILNISYDLLQKYNVQGPRYTSYPPAPSWTSEFGPTQYDTLMGLSNSSQRPLSLYLHLPFCEELCYFCACTTVITGKNHKLEDGYVDILSQEIRNVANRLDSSRPVVQLHWGGGTPTYLSPKNIEKLYAVIQDSFHFAPDIEVGIEVDPRVTTHDHLTVLKNLGFNRISMGVQDFNEQVQKTINRIQPAQATRQLVDKINALGFDSINMDLIYGLPHQTRESFSKTVDQVLAIGPTRLAVYSYAHVPWMKKYQDVFAAHLPESQTKFDIFKVALEKFSQAGFEYIGMDHFARPDDEMTVARNKRTLWRNFMGYTTKAGTDLFGFGMSAISSLDAGFIQNQRKLNDYQSDMQNKGHAFFRGFEMSADDKLRSRVIQNLMCHAEVIKSEIETEFSISFDETFTNALNQLEELERDHIVELKEDRIRPTSLGRLFLRNIAMPFDAYLPKSGDPKMFSRTV